MKKYNYHKLKGEPIPEDANQFVIDTAKKYGSNNLLRGESVIRKGKTFTGSPGAHLKNNIIGEILCWVEAHGGYVKRFIVNKFVFSNGRYDIEQIRNVWNDEQTTFVHADSRNNPDVDFYEEKKKWKPNVEAKEKEVKKDEGGKVLNEIFTS